MRTQHVFLLQRSDTLRHGRHEGERTIGGIKPLGVDLQPLYRSSLELHFLLSQFEGIHAREDDNHRDSPDGGGLCIGQPSYELLSLLAGVADYDVQRVCTVEGEVDAVVLRGSAEVPEVERAPLVAEEEIVDTVLPLCDLQSRECWYQELISDQKLLMVYGNTCTVCLSICLSVCLTVSVCQSTYVCCIYVSIYLSIDLSIYLSMYLPIYLCSFNFHFSGWALVAPSRFALQVPDVRGLQVPGPP